MKKLILFAFASLLSIMAFSQNSDTLDVRVKKVVAAPDKATAVYLDIYEKSGKKTSTGAIIGIARTQPVAVGNRFKLLYYSRSGYSTLFNDTKRIYGLYFHYLPYVE